ncbi:DUF3800 domain-containing protein [Clostridium sp. SHJSY1]|uniref:hypothetical protein n=1 Tax=Clostridium sp. SHJSY1 TaxID=2942483 RepID=UPI002876BBD1|nr:hypothetical protein [Clostridium sp. SHJSY1]MDS0527840.1 DUF3800 domain-containing protein [Clostridium sp. SHJSY1]
MIKHLKKISVFATISLLLTQSTAFATTNKISGEDLYKNTAVQLLKGMKSDKVIEKNIPLYNAKNDESAILFDLNEGYIIIDESTNEISEFSLTEDNKYFKDSSKHYVYCGPTGSYEENSGKLKNLETNEEENNKEKVQEGINRFKKNVEKNQLSNSVKSPKTINKASNNTLYVDRIEGKIPNLSYNPNGICGSCAVGNLLTFFHWNITHGFVPSRYENSVNSGGNGEEFIKSIVPYVDGDSPGSNQNELKSGLKKYLTERVGFKGDVSLYDLSSGPAAEAHGVDKLKSGLPFILGLHQASGNQYGDHWVVAIGFAHTAENDSIPVLYKVINGWGSNEAYVNVAWTDYMVAI